MPCTCTRASSKSTRVQRYYSPLTIRAAFSPERLLTPPPSTLRTSFPLVEISPEESNKHTDAELQLAESGIGDDEYSDIQALLRELIIRYLKPKTCFSKQNVSALETIYEKAKKRFACLRDKDELVTGITRQELRKQNTTRSPS